MSGRQMSLPRRWFILEGAIGPETRAILRRLPRHAGVLVLEKASLAEARRLTSSRNLVIAGDDAARVHNLRELRRALLRRTSLILLSPLYPTSSHPDWPALPRLRAAALARLGGRRLIALGGMDARKFKRVERLGFQGWAGISAWRAR